METTINLTREKGGKLYTRENFHLTKKGEKADVIIEFNYDGRQKGLTDFHLEKMFVKNQKFLDVRNFRNDLINTYSVSDVKIIKAPKDILDIIKNPLLNSCNFVYNYVGKYKVYFEDYLFSSENFTQEEIAKKISTTYKLDITQVNKWLSERIRK